MSPKHIAAGKIFHFSFPLHEINISPMFERCKVDKARRRGGKAHVETGGGEGIIETKEGGKIGSKRMKMRQS
jgi:hypothetical protein